MINKVIKSNPYLNTLMTAKIKVKFGGVCDSDIDCRASGNISRLATLLLLIRTEQSCMMSLLYDNKCDAWSVVCLNFDASLTQCRQFML